MHSVHFFCLNLYSFTTEIKHFLDKGRTTSVLGVRWSPQPSKMMMMIMMMWSPKK